MMAEPEPLRLLDPDLPAAVGASLALGDRPALQWRGEWIPWAWLALVRDRLDALLTAHGVTAGQPVGLVLRNRPAHIAALFAMVATRRSSVFISPFAAPERLASDVASLALPAFICDVEDFDQPLLRDAITARGAIAIALPHEVDEAFAPVVHGSRDPAQEISADADVAVRMLTSGTTGVSKRIPLSWETLGKGVVAHAWAASLMGEAPASGAPEAGLVQYGPVVQMSGFLAALQCGLEGRRLVVLEKFNPASWAEAVSECGLRFAGLPPAMVRMVVEANVAPEKLVSLRGIRSGAAALDDETRQRFEQRYGVPLLTNYGATETAGTIVFWSRDEYARLWDSKRGSTGRFWTGLAEGRVVGAEDHRLLGAKEIGVLELLIPHVSPDWMRTNDLASIDADGFLFIHGRADDAINRGGFKVLPETVADALRKHPSVYDCAVVGLPDARLGAVPAAAIELRKGSSAPTEQEFDSFAREHLLAYQVPVQYLIVDELPRGAAQKIDRTRLRALFGI